MRLTWNDLALNPRVVLGYYTVPPELDTVEVHSLRLHRDGPNLEMTVEMAAFPDIPSPRWDALANSAQGRFLFLGLRKIKIEGWGTSNIGRLFLSRVPNGVRFEFRGGSVSCVGVSDWFDITGITAYISEKRNA
jgi:hypothetical protein